MNGWVWVGLICVGMVCQHFYLRWTRDKILDSVHQNEVGRADLFIKTREKHYNQLFPSSWRFPAEVIVTETGIYIFRYIGLFGYTKIFVKYHCLYAVEQDILFFLQQRLNTFRFIHQVDLLQIEGRKVTIEFGEYVSWTTRPFRTYRFVLEDVRGNNIYHNLLRFQRYRYDVLQSQSEAHNLPLRAPQNYARRQAKLAEELLNMEEKSDKERIIDGLTSTYRHERANTIKHLWEFDRINGQILYLLKDISNNDPDLQVRKAARELIDSRN